MDLKETDAVDPSSHWYYQSKLAVIGETVERHSPRVRTLLDVGAGAGYFAGALAERWRLASAVCVDPNYAEPRREAPPLTFVRTYDGPGADLLLFTDVLEHVDEPDALLREYTDRLAAPATVVITVPAFQALWSAHDVFLEHRRRYRLHEVVDLARGVGLEVLETRYLFAAIFPLAFLVRRLRRGGAPRSDMRPVPPVLNALLLRLVRLEHWLLRQRVCGLTAMVVARTPGRPGAGRHTSSS
jgi:hypothetical protein